MTTVLELAASDPVAAFAPVANDALAVLLDSAASGDPRSRYSYICADPVDVLPADEYDETLVKAAPLLAALAGGAP